MHLIHNKGSNLKKKNLRQLYEGKYDLNVLQPLKI